MRHGKRVTRDGAKGKPTASSVGVLAILLFLHPTARAHAADQPFVVHTAKNKAIEGSLRELTTAWSVHLDKKNPIPGEDVISLRRPGAGLPPLPEGPHLRLTNGDVIAVQEARLSGERVLFRHPALNKGDETSVPLGMLALYWRIAPSDGTNPQTRQRRLLAGTRVRDVVLLRNGDTVEGSLTGLDAVNAEMEVEKKRVKIELARVAAVALSTELADHTKPKGTYGRLALTGKEHFEGTRLSVVQAASADGETLTATTTFGVPLRVAMNQVAALDLFQGKAVYLSDLKPTKYEAEPFLDVRWPLVADGCANGREIRLANGVYDKGLGMHARSQVTYKLDGGYQRFEALVGLDPRGGAEGSVRLRVLADGKPLAVGIARELTGRDAPVPIAVSVAGVKELTLVVDFGRRGDVQAHVNWADARVVK